MRRKILHALKETERTLLQLILIKWQQITILDDNKSQQIS